MLSKCRKNLKKYEAEFMARPEGIRAKNKVIFEISTVEQIRKIVENSEGERDYNWPEEGQRSFEYSPDDN